MGKLDDKFHRHLDVCKQCREHPFAMCGVGDLLLRATVNEVAIEGAHKLFGLTAPATCTAECCENRHARPCTLGPQR